MSTSCSAPNVRRATDELRSPWKPCSRLQFMYPTVMFVYVPRQTTFEWVEGNVDYK